MEAVKRFTGYLHLLLSEIFIAADNELLLFSCISVHALALG